MKLCSDTDEHPKPHQLRRHFELTLSQASAFDARIEALGIRVKRMEEFIRKDVVANTSEITGIVGELAFEGCRTKFHLQKTIRFKVNGMEPGHVWQLYIGSVLDKPIGEPSATLLAKLDQTFPLEGAPNAEGSNRANVWRWLLIVLWVVFCLVPFVGLFGLAIYGAVKLFPP